MIVVKGSHVILHLEDGRALHLPARLGVAHDPEGHLLARHEVYFAPYHLRHFGAPMGSSSRRYFGSHYDLAHADVDIPKGQWNPVGKVIAIDYRRPAGLRVGDGAIHEGDYKHAFACPQSLWRAAGAYCLVLPVGAAVNERGFVYP